MRSLRERMNASERAAEGLKSDLSAMVTQRDNTQAELHQARLQAAQLTLQLADSTLALREERARWAQERQSLQHTAEVPSHCKMNLNLKWRISVIYIYIYMCYSPNSRVNSKLVRCQYIAFMFVSFCL